MKSTHPALGAFAAILGGWLAVWPPQPVFASVTSIGDNAVRFSVETKRLSIEEFDLEGDTYRSVRLFGAGRTRLAGLPDLPVRSYWVAVPEGHTAAARVVEIEDEDLAGAPVEPAGRDTVLGGVPVVVPAIDQGFYASSAWFPDPLVSVGEPARLRHQLLVPVVVHPVRFQPSTGVLRVARRMVVEVVFVPDGAKRGEERREPAGEEGAWEDVYRGAVLNIDQGRSFRTRVPRAAAPRAKKLALFPEYEISVEKSGLYRIDFSELEKDGLAAGRPIESLALLRRGYDDDAFEAGGNPFTEISIPLHVFDAASDGLFGNGDYLVVYLPGFREDRMKKETDDRYAYRAVYYLSVEGGRPPLGERGGWRGYPGLSPLASFPDSIRWEVDSFYNIEVNVDTIDLYFPGSYVEQSVRVTEAVLPAVDTSLPYGVKAMTVSLDDDQNPYHRYILTSQASGDTVLDVVVQGAKARLFGAEKIFPSSSLAPGANRFLYQGMRGATPEGNAVEGARGFLDWYEIHANFLYRATGDKLLFSSGEGAGRYQIEAGGFTTPEVLLFDVSDPYAPVRVLADSVRSVAGAYTVVLQDSTGAPKRYAACTAASATRITASSIVPDDPTDIASNEGDFLIVAWGEFADEMEPLAAHRASQGYAPRIVSIDDVYDAFNGGIKDPRAIARYVRFAFERWTKAPVALLLVGDGYEDAKGIAENADPTVFDFIPTWSNYQPFAHLEVSGDHWDAGDHAYVLLDGPRDPLPDLLLGRLPVRSEEEAALVVAKTIDYETIGADDAWRSRALFLADDAWVFASGALRNYGQIQFERNSALFAREMKETAAKGIDTVNVFLSRYTNVYHPLCPYALEPNNGNAADVACAINLARQGVTGALFDEINGEGIGFLNYQGHGNRNVLSHEVVLRNGVSYQPSGNNVSEDIREKSDHAGRPYIFMGYGCSISEFDRFLSIGYESIPEEMIVSDRGGAVAAFGSSGTELLDENLDLNESILKYFFETPGVVPGADPDSMPPYYEGTPRWTIGEMIALGLADFSAGASTRRFDIIRRYVLFGDPLLRLDARPPHFEVTVDGEPVKDGDALLGSEDGGPVEIVARVHDEVRIDRSSIRVTEADLPLDTTLYSVVPDDSLAEGGRAWKIVYPATVRFGEYAIVFRAVDGAGREGTFTLRVRVGVDVTFDGAPIAEGDYVGREPLIRAVITTPVPVPEEDLRIELDGSPADTDTLQPLDSFRWLAVLRPSLGSGEHTLLFAVRALEQTVRFRVEDRFRVVGLLNHPNPTESSTGFYYNLTDSADRVRAEVFTLGGKKVRVIDGLSGRVGYNANPDAWDGSDADGDRVANGVYLFRIVATRAGEKTEAIGKAVVTR